MIVINKDKLIKSRFDYISDDEIINGGVKIRNIKPILNDLLENKIWVNNYDTEVPEGKRKFVIRRWYK